VAPSPSATPQPGGAERFDVVTMGRVGVDVYPHQVGVGLEDVESFGKFLGGSPTNVAVAAARYGHRAAVVTKTGTDPFGRFVRRALRGFGVDDRFVGASEHLPTPVTFCEIFPPDDFPIYFYRFPKAPDLDIGPDELDFDAIRSARVFWATVTGLCQEPSRSATLAALEARSGTGTTVLDLDYRPMFWDSPEAAREQVRRALPHATVAVGNREECDVAVGTRATPDAAALALREAGVALAVVKQGPEGVLALDGTGRVAVPPVPVEVVNGLGAGDAFGGALVHGLLAGWPLERTIRFANAAGAHVAGQLACADAMPTEAQVERRLEAAAANGGETGAENATVPDAVEHGVHEGDPVERGTVAN
jgi:5-dehydro-2-deoxygluconokinase